MCVGGGVGRGVFSPMLIRAGGAYRVLTPNLSAVWIGWPSASFPLTSSHKGRLEMSDDPPLPPPFVCDVMFASCVLMWWWGEAGGASFLDQNKGCLQCVDAQPVCSLDWLALNFLPAHFFP